MNYSVVITDQAGADIRSIYNYIAYSLLSIQNAINQVNRIEQQIYSLDEFPRRYPKANNLNILGNLNIEDIENLRYMTVDKYYVFYQVFSNNFEVHITRVVYSRYDISNVLNRSND